MGECVLLVTSDSPHVLHQVTKKAVSLQEHACDILMKMLLRDYSTIQLSIPQLKTVSFT